MTIKLQIPKELEKHFNQDKFNDSLLRIATDITAEIKLDSAISGRYELELLGMLIASFEDSVIVEQ